MAYIKYNVDVNQSVYADYERLRKDYVGKKLSKQGVLTMLDLCGLPSESPKVFALAMEYELILRHGKSRGTYYMVPKDQIPYSRFEGLEKDFYNGCQKSKQPQKPAVTEHETGRTMLDEDFCLRYLKERGYMCFKLTPNLMKLQQSLTPQFLLENMDAVLK